MVICQSSNRKLIHVSSLTPSSSPSGNHSWECSMCSDSSNQAKAETVKLFVKSQLLLWWLSITLKAQSYKQPRQGPGEPVGNARLANATCVFSESQRWASSRVLVGHIYYLCPSHTLSVTYPLFTRTFFFNFFFFYCSGFCHTLKWNSHGLTCVPHPDPPSHLPLHPIPLGLPSAPGPGTCLMHPTWATRTFKEQFGPTGKEIQY